MSKNLQQKLTNYHILIEDVVGWNSRQVYLNLFRSFLLNEIGGLTFASEFMKIRNDDMSKVVKLSEKIEEDKKPIPDFCYTSKSEDFNSAIDNIYFAITQYDPDLEDSD
jgi:hypothetical protein